LNKDKLTLALYQVVSFLRQISPNSTHQFAKPWLTVANFPDYVL